MRTLVAAMCAVFVMGAAAGFAAEKTASGPESVMAVLKRAYDEKSMETMAGLLSAEYLFHSSASAPAGFAKGSRGTRNCGACEACLRE